MRAFISLLVVAVANVASADPWRVTDTKTKGVETEIRAANAPLDLIASVALDGQFVIRDDGKRVTGDVIAPSTPAAVRAAFDASGGAMPPTFKPTGHGATVTMQFIDAPSEDLLRLLADTLRANVVVAAGASLPHLALRVRRVPADGVIEQVAAVLGLVVRRQGVTYYLTPKPLPLPALEKLPATVVSLETKGAPAKLAAAALAAVTGTKPATCTDVVLALRVKRVPLTEAVRALAVATGALAPGECAIAPSRAIDVSKLKLVAIATSGTKRIAAGTVDGTPVLLASGNGVDVGDGYVTVGAAVAQLYPIPSGDPAIRTSFPTWRARIARTALVVRRGTSWSAWFATTDGKFIEASTRAAEDAVDDALNPPEVAIDARGVSVTYEAKTELIPLR